MSATNPQEKKLGLCLSGGGFRASLFHIGVLAALAEREMLHKVEVLSTVSGGSIIGAYYYLKVKRLLEGRVPGTPSPSCAAYRQIVQEIEQDFLAAVQKNIRLRLFMNPRSNLRMAGEDYSRSDRLADLLNMHFYNAAGGQTNILLKDMHIHPGDQQVKAKDYNLNAEFKIPILVLNATCLNTGHPWHFTGISVGEPESRRAFDAQVDTNFRLPPLRFDGIYHDDRDLPLAERRRLNEGQQRKLDCITLAHAVAASAAVPGIFPPLAIHDLYTSGGDQEIVVELSDGGVFDNQGVDALYQHECRHMVISDASGQLEDQLILGTKFHQVVQRANDIMMDKIRSETLYRTHAGWEADAALAKWSIDPLEASKVSVLKENALDGYALIHLRQAFPNTAENPNFPDPVNRPEGAVYRLSGIRTDLDAFSDAEAYALMYDGYQLLHDQLGSSPLNPLSSTDWQPNKAWRFLAIRDVLRDHHRRDWLHARIKVGSKQFFRAFQLRPGLSWGVAIPLLAGVGVGLWWAICLAFHTPPQIACPAGCQPVCTAGFCIPADILVFQGKITMQEVLLAILAVLALWLPVVGAIQEWLKKFGLVRWLRPKGVDLIAGIGLTVLLTLFAVGIWGYRQIFDRIFLADGRMK